MSDHQWEQEWGGDLSIMEQDYDGTSQVSVNECPKCAAIVITRNRTAHEAVCWNV